jgi:Uma2 family endonuclease
MSVDLRADSRRLQEVLDDLGGVPPSRILMNPAPGQATEEDAIRLMEREKILCELVDGVLVEKSMGYAQSVLAIFLARLLDEFAEEHGLGSVSGADGYLRLIPGSLRAPDVAFISWGRLPDDTLPRLIPVPQAAPELVVEVLSDGNTPREMARKRDDYFKAGVLVVWEVDPRSRTVTVHRPDAAPRTLAPGDVLEAGDILPGFQVAIDRLFGKLDGGREKRPR